MKEEVYSALSNAPKLDFHRFYRTLQLYPYALEGDISFFGDGARVAVAFEIEQFFETPSSERKLRLHLPSLY